MILYKRYIIFFTAILTVVCFIFFIISIYFGNNPLNNRLSSKMRMVSIMPEGWAFFTRASNEPRQYIYKINGNNLSEINLRNISAEYYFGMSRDNRILFLQFNTVFQKINNDSSKFYSYRSINVNAVTSKIKLDTLKYNEISMKRDVTPNVNGKYLMIVELMLPWSLLNRDANYPTNFIVYPINVNLYE